MKKILLLLLILFTVFVNAQNADFQIKDSLVELNSVISSAEFVYSGKIDIAPVPDVLRSCLQTNVAYENDETTITIQYDQMCQFIGSVRLELLDVKNATNLRGDRPKIYVYFGQTADVLIITDRRELETNLPMNYYGAINSYIDKAAELGLSAKYVEINSLPRKELSNDTISFIADNYYVVNYQYSSDKEDVQNTIKQITNSLSPKLLYILGGYDIVPTFEVAQSEIVFHQKMQSDESYGSLEDAKEISVVQNDAIDEGYIYSPNDFQKLIQAGPASYAIPIDLQNHDVKYDAKGSSFYSQRKHGRHNGIDFFAPIGVPVYAADSGIINDARFVKESCGNMIVLKTDSENQIDWFKYCHLDHFAPGIQKGMHVIKGQLIAYSGNSQAADTGAHLHFEAYIGGTWASEKNKATPINAVTLYPNINFPTTSYKELNELSIDTQQINNLITARLYTSNIDENPAKTIADYLTNTNQTLTPTNPAFILRAEDESTPNTNVLFKHFQNTPCDVQNNCFEIPLICLNQNNCNETSKDILQKYNVLILNLRGTPNSSFVKIKEEKIQFTTAKELFNSIQNPAVIIAEQANTLNTLDANGVEIEDSYALQATEHSSTLIGRNGPYVIKLLEYLPQKEYTDSSGLIPLYTQKCDQNAVQVVKSANLLVLQTHGTSDAILDRHISNNNGKKYATLFEKEEIIQGQTKFIVGEQCYATLTLEDPENLLGRVNSNPEEVTETLANYAIQKSSTIIGKNSVSAGTYTDKLKPGKKLAFNLLLEAKKAILSDPILDQRQKITQAAKLHLVGNPFALVDLQKSQPKIAANTPVVKRG